MFMYKAKVSCLQKEQNTEYKDRYHLFSSVIFVGGRSECTKISCDPSWRRNDITQSSVLQHRVESGPRANRPVARTEERARVASTGIVDGEERRYGGQIFAADKSVCVVWSGGAAATEDSLKVNRSFARTSPRDKPQDVKG
ncbi:hypothetical protein J6590_033805 [Homalodisca vitripennis]|nr:hypothetical protein J6590_033805 [Homalodisca vitripennis]